ncbi:MAG: WD40 repeat domain-containing protein [Candidatus Xenobia bacterium]
MAETLRPNSPDDALAQLNGILSAVCAAPDGSVLAAYDRPGTGNTLSRWDAGTEHVLFTGPEQKATIGPVATDGTHIAFSDAPTLHCIGADGSILWEHQYAVRGMTFTGNVLVTAGDDGTGRWWDATDGQMVRSVQPGLGRLTALAVSADGKSSPVAGGKSMPRNAVTEPDRKSNPPSG